MKRVQY